MHPRNVQIVAVLSTMTTAATAAFAWAASRYVDTLALHYAVPLVVTCTIWLLTVAFTSAVLWEAGRGVGQYLAKPKRYQLAVPSDIDEPEQWLARVRRARRLQPPADSTTTTLVDQFPAVTQEIPRVDDSWRPPASDTARHRGD